MYPVQVSSLSPHKDSPGCPGCPVSVPLPQCEYRIRGTMKSLFTMLATVRRRLWLVLLGCWGAGVLESSAEDSDGGTDLIFGLTSTDRSRHLLNLTHRLTILLYYAVDYCVLCCMLCKVPTGDADILSGHIEAEIQHRHNVDTTLLRCAQAYQCGIYVVASS
jgi:hypothetical protein